ncbi:MAG TPA: DUF4124 domain-containing protein [Burkholderiales bacterium]|jgi:hypothetical protein|nr:DUF4124 domain-containing protein [Burkholderiales bacterium]
MNKALVFMAGLAFAAAAAAQSKWVDKDGRVTYGDAPPQGVNVQSMRRSAAPVPAAEDASADKKEDAKDAKKPLTAAEQDAAFRKRQQDAEKESQKQAQAERDTAEKRENCARAQENVRVLEAGRVARYDSKGERYFLDDSQIASETVKARQDAREWCK